MDDLSGLDVIDENAIEVSAGDFRGRFGAGSHFDDARNPLSCFSGELLSEEFWMASKFVLDGFGDGFALVGGDGDITQGGDDALPRLALGIAEGLDELDEWGAFNGFGTQEHLSAG